MKNTLNCPEITYTCKKVTFKKIVANYKDPDYKNRQVIRNSWDAYVKFRFVFEEFMQHHEEAWVMFLSNANRVLGMSCLGVGGLDSAVVDVRIIFQTALMVNATQIMIAHNHPNGTLKSSAQDDFITKKIAKAGELLDIKLLDHIILSVDGYYSFSEQGLL